MRGKVSFNNYMIFCLATNCVNTQISSFCDVFRDRSLEKILGGGGGGGAWEGRPGNLLHIFSSLGKKFGIFFWATRCTLISFSCNFPLHEFFCTSNNRPQHEALGNKLIIEFVGFIPRSLIDPDVYCVMLNFKNPN